MARFQLDRDTAQQVGGWSGRPGWSLYLQVLDFLATFLGLCSPQGPSQPEETLTWLPLHHVDNQVQVHFPLMFNHPPQVASGLAVLGPQGEEDTQGSPGAGVWFD